MLSLTSAARAQALTVSTQPSLNPAFNETVTDYVTRCTAGTPVNVNVTAAPGTGVDVDRQGTRTGTFATSVSLNPGQGFEIVATTGATTATYHVRCLPADFPSWTFDSIRQRPRSSGSPPLRSRRLPPGSRGTTSPSTTRTGCRSGGRRPASSRSTSTSSPTATSSGLTSRARPARNAGSTARSRARSPRAATGIVERRAQPCCCQRQLPSERLANACGIQLLRAARTGRSPTRASRRSRPVERREGSGTPPTTSR